jgi:hypothetical protein
LVEPILQEILYTTSAHSVSMRIYNPETQSLDVMSTATALGAHHTRDVRAIKLKGNERRSVNVFTFLDGGVNFPWIYLKRLSPPRVTIRHGKEKVQPNTTIELKYKNKGLEAVLQARDLTRSEICFPLMHGKLPFGTLNLEAPFPAAFDHDELFLNEVKLGIEQAYSRAAAFVDGGWLLAHAARSDAVHQLWQYLDAGEFFAKHQANLLETLFPNPLATSNSRPVPLSSLAGKLNTWIGRRYDVADLRRRLKDLVKYDATSDRPVDPHLFSAAFLILQNLIQNIVKHGEPEEDIIAVDDRSWFGRRARECLRIRYVSRKPADATVLGVLSLAPIRKDQRIAYGMYNVGMLTRLLGGSLYIANSTTTGFTIEFHLPLPMEHAS